MRELDERVTAHELTYWRAFFTIEQEEIDRRAKSPGNDADA